MGRRHVVQRSQRLSIETEKFGKTPQRRFANNLEPNRIFRFGFAYNSIDFRSIKSWQRWQLSKLKGGVIGNSGQRSPQTQGQHRAYSSC